MPAQGLAKGATAAGSKSGAQDVGQSLTGSRIRERRLMAGLRQADLAQQVGISASYLNLIEHNRRRIGGKLLVNLAQALGVEPSLLTEGAEATLLAALREAAADANSSSAEIDKLEEFAGRFPGWAEVVSAAHRRIATLEQTVRTLSDRLTHDAHLAASLHEVLSTAASIRSTASILAETGELEAEWRDRFHQNLNEDSLRLAESSRALVSFLDEGDTSAERRGVPQEEVEAFFAEHDFHFAELEAGRAHAEELIGESPQLESDAARKMALRALDQYLEDARLLPMTAMDVALAGQAELNPAALAQEFNVALPVMLRRLGVLSEEVLGRPSGLVICDASGSILFRKPVRGFNLPRFGASCPLWPLFTALTRPHRPIRRRVMQQSGSARPCNTFAVSWAEGPVDFQTDPMLQAVMLILPEQDQEGSAPATEVPQSLGSSCRICARPACPARREPSILRDAPETF
ncbi:transcriptional regulator, y4mF family [Tritonibacter multivorans]|uniref:Transcriptional regulator, y4mF family n=1 Tax=Tritonibacter multivorans TaxID=928856 RepID=A0A0P1H2B2_9RHOB|nr:transcriptional regulator, y4mF family [Tritonibacter multivorans]SFC34526.1 hypothetical protein SAMN04488049_102235 [Tritonibacter multivorans]